MSNAELPPLRECFKPDGTKWGHQEYECVSCGETARNSFIEPVKAQMTERRLCYTCNYWVNQDKRIERDYAKLTIIGGTIYGPGNRTEGSFRGMGGRRFDIEYLEGSNYVGKKITTFDLWAGSQMPKALRAKYPDNAKFLGGAQRHQVGETGCWSASDTRAEPYPLPREYGIGK